HAGKSNIAGARDIHGNSRDGTLAHAGAYAGMQITVLIYSCEDKMNFSRTRTIAENLGFKVVVYDGAIRPFAWTGHLLLKYLTDDALDDVLNNSSQCWILSGVGSERSNGVTMYSSQRDIILKHWRQGMGLYVLGDNDP